ncbi:uncharacterized protein METZ01_LOCUS82672, partial [marine metagenome]
MKWDPSFWFSGFSPRQEIAADKILNPGRQVRMVNRANNTRSRISLLSDHPIAFLGLRCNALLSYTDAA